MNNETTTANAATTTIPAGTKPAPFTLKLETGITIPSTRNRQSAQNPIREQVMVMTPSSLDKSGEIVGEIGSSTVVANPGERNKVVNAVKKYRQDCRVISRQTDNGQIRLWLVNKAYAPAKAKAAGKTE